MSSRLVKILCTFLVFAFPASLVFAESHAAMVFASGQVTLNGTAVLRSTAIFEGDRLETSRNSVVSIHTNGSTIQMSPTSHLRFEGSIIDLEDGVVQISTRNGMRVVAGTFTFGPTFNTATFQVVHGVGGVRVAVLNGSLAVKNGSKMELLAAGETKSFDDDTDPQKKDRDRGAATAPTNKELFVWASVALGVSGFLAWLFTRDDRKPLSSQLP